MLCKKHQIEECNSSDCESCNLEIRIKQLEAKNQKFRDDRENLLDHAKWLHELLDQMPCEFCKEIEQKILEGK